LRVTHEHQRPGGEGEVAPSETVTIKPDDAGGLTIVITPPEEIEEPVADPGEPMPII
jgi:hypothetical protein